MHWTIGWMYPSRKTNEPCQGNFPLFTLWPKIYTVYFCTCLSCSGSHKSTSVHSVRGCVYLEKGCSLSQCTKYTHLYSRMEKHSKSFPDAIWKTLDETRISRFVSFIFIFVESALLFAMICEHLPRSPQKHLSLSVLNNLIRQWFFLISLKKVWWRSTFSHRSNRCTCRYRWHMKQQAM